MKKFISMMFFVSIFASSAQAITWYDGGVLFGNVCRYGMYYTEYPTVYGIPVGSSCIVRDAYGAPIYNGVVTAE
jgi:hypothetical protein